VKSLRLSQRRLGILAALVSLLFVVGTTTATAAPAGAATSQSYRTETDQIRQPSSYQLHFHNYYKSTVSIALMYKDYSGKCRYYGGWATAGWSNVGWDDDAYVLSTRNRYVYYYAYSWDGAAKWSGDAAYIYVRTQAFKSCRDIEHASPWYQVGLKEIDMGPGFKVYTVNLTP